MHISRLVNLTRLGLRGAEVTDEGFRHLEDLRRLELLDLTNTDITDKGLKRIAKLKALKTLFLHSAEITGNGLLVLKELPHLQNLSLYQTPIAGDSLSTIAQFPALETLNLSHCDVDGRFLKHLVGMRHLKRVDFAYNPLTDDSLKYVAQMNNLQSLIFSLEDVTEDGLRQLKVLKNLRYLSIYDEISPALLVELRGALPNTHVSTNNRAVANVNENAGVIERGLRKHAIVMARGVALAANDGRHLDALEILRVYHGQEWLAGKAIVAVPRGGSVAYIDFMAVPFGAKLPVERIATVEPPHYPTGFYALADSGNKIRPDRNFYNRGAPWFDNRNFHQARQWAEWFARTPHLPNEQQLTAVKELAFGPNPDHARYAIDLLVQGEGDTQEGILDELATDPRTALTARVQVDEARRRLKGMDWMGSEKWYQEVEAWTKAKLAASKGQLVGDVSQFLTTSPEQNSRTALVIGQAIALDPSVPLEQRAAIVTAIGNIRIQATSHPSTFEVLARILAKSTDDAIRRAATEAANKLSDFLELDRERLKQRAAEIPDEAIRKVMSDALDKPKE